MSTPTDVPLSSLDAVPMTSDTRAALIEAGVPESRLVGLSELGAQSLLVLHREMSDDDGQYAPGCFRAMYDPTASLCRGCVYSPRCWRSDRRYLERLGREEVGPPPGVPAAAVKARLEQIAAMPSPPAPPRKKPPPAPPARKAPPPPPRRQG